MLSFIIISSSVCILILLNKKGKIHLNVNILKIIISIYLFKKGGEGLLILMEKTLLKQ